MNDSAEPREPSFWSGRNFARFSVIAPHAALLFACVVGWVRGGDYESPIGVFVGVVVISTMFVLLGGGLAAGFIGIWNGRKTGASETVAIAYLGVFLSGGALIFFGALMVRTLLST